MNKKTRNVLILVMLAVFCLLLFAACNNEKPDIFEYSEDDLGVMGKLVRWLHIDLLGKGNYGWAVVIFTVFLKIVMLPLTFWQTYASRKSALKMQQMQPVIEDIDKRYGANTQRANEEKQKLYKKQGFSMMSSCLPMIVLMVVFMVMFTGLRNYSTYSSITNFKQMYNKYYDVYTEQITEVEGSELYVAYYDGIPEKNIKGYTSTYNDALNVDGDSEEIAKFRAKIQGITAAMNADRAACEEYKQKALEEVKKYYEENHESWLWIENVWQPDTWADIMQPYTGNSFEGNGFSNTVNLEKFPGGVEVYDDIRNAVLATGGHGENGSWNGLMILPFLSIGLSFLSMFISQRMERKNRKGQNVEQNAQQKMTSRMMMILMPLMMAYFGFIYTGAFAIYMVVNYTLSILTTVVMRYPVEKFVTKRLNKDDKKKKSDKASYMR